MTKFDSELSAGGDVVVLDRTPQWRSLVVTRRWLVVVLTALFTALVELSGLLHWSALSPPDRAGLVLAGVLGAIGWATSRRSEMLWFCVAGILCFVALALLGRHADAAWLPMPNVAAYPVYFAITLSSRRVGLIVALLGPFLVEIIWLVKPGNVIAGLLAVGDGWLAVAQVMAASLGVWVAWHLLMKQAHFADLEFQEQQTRTLESLEIQERARVWRSAATQLHESVLNSVRYVLTTSEPDTHHFMADRVGALPDTPARGRGSTALLSAVKSDVVAGSIVQVVSDIDVPLMPDVFDAARAALIEVARNALLHGRATRVEITCLAGNESHDLCFEVTNDGGAIPPQAAAGIGTATVLGEGLAAVGGRIEFGKGIESSQVIIHVPALAVGLNADQYRQSFDKGRLLITVPLAASSIVGLSYFVLLLSRNLGWNAVSATVLATASTLTAAGLVLRRRRIFGWQGLGLVVCAALVPWALFGVTGTCDVAPNVSAALNVSGYSAVVIATWIGTREAVLGLSIWAVGALALMLNYPSQCHQIFAVAIANSMVLLPVAILIAAIGVTANQRVIDRTEQIRLLDVAERSRATAEVDLNVSLHDATNDAFAVLTSVSQGHPVDEEVRVELLTIDARIRGAIQVDPVRSGEFAIVAKQIIDATAHLGRPIQVKAIGGSSDRRPLPADLSRRLSQALSSCSADLLPVVQVFTDGEHDFLSVVVDQTGVWAGHFVPHSTLHIDDVHVDVFGEDHDDVHSTRFTILVERPVVLSKD